MNSISSILSASGASIRKSFRRFPMTQAALALFIILTAFATDFFGRANGFKPIDHVITPFLMMLTFGFFLIEASAIRKNGVKIGMIALAAAIAAFFALTHPEINPMKLDEAARETVERIRTFYVVLCLCLAVRAILSQAHISIDEFAKKIYGHGFAAAIVLGCFSLGVLLVTGIFETLFLSGSYELIPRVWIFCALSSFSIGVFYAIENLDQAPGKFFITIGKYVLLPVLALAFMIIYGYIAKILITQIIPSNEIFPILSSLFCIGAPIWTMNRAMDHDDRTGKLVDLLPLLFIPFIALQGYSIWLRISEFGLTTTRYLGCALIALEIVYFTLYFFHGRKTEGVLTAAVVLAALAYVVPGINSRDLPFNRQLAALNAYATNPDTFDESDLYRVAGAYNYLKSVPGGMEAMETIDAKILDKIESLPLARSEDRSYYNFWGENNEKIDVIGFSAIRPNIYCNSEYNETVDLSAIACYLPDSVAKDPERRPTPFLTIDFSEIYATYATVRSAESRQLETNQVPLPNGDVLWLESLSFEIDENGEVRYFSANGFYLEK